MGQFVIKTPAADLVAAKATRGKLDIASFDFNHETRVELGSKVVTVQRDVQLVHQSRIIHSFGYNQVHFDHLSQSDAVIWRKAVREFRSDLNAHIDTQPLPDVFHDLAHRVVCHNEVLSTRIADQLEIAESVVNDMEERMMSFLEDQSATHAGTALCNVLLGQPIPSDEQQGLYTGFICALRVLLQGSNLTDSILTNMKAGFQLTTEPNSNVQDFDDVLEDVVSVVGHLFEAIKSQSRTNVDADSPDGRVLLFATFFLLVKSAMCYRREEMSFKDLTINLDPAATTGNALKLAERLNDKAIHYGDPATINMTLWDDDILQHDLRNVLEQASFTSLDSGVDDTVFLDADADETIESSMVSIFDMKPDVARQYGDVAAELVNGILDHAVQVAGLNYQPPERIVKDSVRGGLLDTGAGEQGATFPIVLMQYLHGVVVTDGQEESRMKYEGVFRGSANHRLLAEAWAWVEEKQGLITLEELEARAPPCKSNILLYSAMLKQYFCGLAEPLIPARLVRYLILANRMKNPLVVLQMVVSQLSTIHAKVLNMWLELIALVVSPSIDNKMTIDHGISVFESSLIDHTAFAPGENGLMAAEEWKSDVNQSLKLLIHHHQDIWKINRAISDKAVKICAFDVKFMDGFSFINVVINDEISVWQFHSDDTAGEILVAYNYDPQRHQLQIHHTDGHELEDPVLLASNSVLRQIIEQHDKPLFQLGSVNILNLTVHGSSEI
eukprot:TRINITY_DN11566_c0_g1_i15.p1 TRINITY_DN11566_c0_g1~~TRINITY_DN11566_c0_g1_i15.p1  ORF type:complete len:727 (+),score=139.07 TRINITY_DN11566_c0_g1_i15:2-2182(+)